MPSAQLQTGIDFGKHLQFPEHITSTTVRPDTAIFSNSTKQVIIVELSMPWEECSDRAQEERAIKPVSDATRWLWLERETPWSTAASWGLITPSWVAGVCRCDV